MANYRPRSWRQDIYLAGSPVEQKREEDPSEVKKVVKKIDPPPKKKIKKCVNPMFYNEVIRIKMSSLFYVWWPLTGKVRESDPHLVVPPAVTPDGPPANIPFSTGGSSRPIPPLILSKPLDNDGNWQVPVKPPKPTTREKWFWCLLVILYSGPPKNSLYTLRGRKEGS